MQFEDYFSILSNGTSKFVQWYLGFQILEIVYFDI